MTAALAITHNSDFADFTADFPLAFYTERTEALALTGDIVQVTSDTELADCVAASSLAHALAKGVKAAYDEAKAPILVVTKRLDSLHHGAVDALVLEKKRLDALATAYVTARDAKARQEREQAEADLAARTEAAAAAGASSDELRDLAQQRQELAPVPGVAGALVRQVWDYEVLSAAALFRAYPDLVDLVPRRALILAAIAGGVNLPGLRVYAETKVRPRA